MLQLAPTKALAAVLHDRLCQWVIAQALDRNSERQEILFARPLDGYDIGDAGPTFRQRPGLVERDRLEGTKVFKRRAALD